MYGYPVTAAAKIAVSTTLAFLQSTSSALTEVTFCCFSAGDVAAYEKVLVEYEI